MGASPAGCRPNFSEKVTPASIPRHKLRSLATLFGLGKKKVLSDEELVRRIVEDKRSDDFGQLYDRYSQKVYHKCISFVKDLDLAQDLTHDIFLKVFVSLSRFNHQSRFSTWLYSVTYNFCVDYIRKNSKVRQEGEEALANVADTNDSAEERELMQMEAQRLQRVLDTIPVKDKMILLMKYQDEMSVQDIMAAMEVAESAVKMRLKRARQRALEAYREMFNHPMTG